MPSNTSKKKNTLPLKTVSAAVFSALLCSNVDARAAGLGALTVQSFLGQPLHAEVEVVSTSREEDGPLTVKLASFEAFRQANVEYTPALQSLRFAITSRGDRLIVRVTSAQPLNEPFIAMLLELGSGSGRVVREYVFLLDPASPDAPQIAIAAPGNVATPKAAPTQESRPTPSAVQSPRAPQAKPAATSSVANAPAPQAAQQSAGSAAPVRPAPPEKAAARPSEQQRIAKPATTDAAAGKPRLTLSSPGVVPGATNDKTAGVGIEQYAAMEKTVAEANARVEALEQKLGDMLKLLEATNSLLAEVRKQSDLVKENMSPAPASAAAAANAPGAPIVGTPAAAAPAAGTPPAPAPAPAPVAPPAPKPAATPPEASFLTSDPFILPGAGLLAALLGVLGIYALRRRKAQKPFAADMFADSREEPNTPPPVTGGRSVDPANNVSNSTFVVPASDSDTDEVDALSEANVYIAYGRDVQAEEVLQEALRKDPARHALRVRLLTIYAGRNDRQAFESLAREMYGMTRGEGEEWMQTATMGTGIDPGNPLYAAGKPASIAPANSRLTTPAAPLQEHRAEAVPAAARLQPLAALAGGIAAQSSAPGKPALAVDVPELRAKRLADPVPTEGINSAAADAANNDLDFGLDEPGLDDVALPPIPSVVDELKAETGPIDFDFDLPDLPSAGTPEEAAEIRAAVLDAPKAETGPIDFNFDLPDLPEMGTSEDVAEVQPAALTEPQAEVGPIDFDFLLPDTTEAGKDEADQTGARRNG